MANPKGVMRWYSLLVFCYSLACESTPVNPPAKPEPEKTAAAPNAKKYGAVIGAGEKTTLSSVLANPKTFGGKSVVVEGDVRRACQRKGCWMEIAESKDPAARGARVTFKDYGFFVPTDSAGAHARLEGIVNVETVSAAKVEHLESEGAKFAAKNPDGTAEEVQLVASGVELSR